MGKIEEKLNKVHQYIKRYHAENGFPPSVREMCAALNISSTATCQYYIDKLRERGVVSSNPNKKRSISVYDQAEYVSVPIVGTVTAGTPILAVENLEGYFPLPPEFARNDETFMLTVRGDSMIEAGIFNGDKIICKKTNYADNGEIVVALVEDSATVKRFYKRHGKFILHPENSELCDIVLNEVEILGKVTGLIRKF